MNGSVNARFIFSMSHQIWTQSMLRPLTVKLPPLDGASSKALESEARSEILNGKLPLR